MKLKKQITIGITEDDQCAISITPDTTCTEAFQLLGTLASHILNAYYQIATHEITTKDHPSKEEKIAAKGFKDSMYDAFDTLASNILADFNPTHPRYTLEDEVILELVDKRIQEEYDQLTPEDKSRYAQAYNKMKLQTEYRNRITKRPDVSTGTDEEEVTSDSDN